MIFKELSNGLQKNIFFHTILQYLFYLSLTLSLENCRLLLK